MSSSPRLNGTKVRRLGLDPARGHFLLNAKVVDELPVIGPLGLAVHCVVERQRLLQDQWSPDDELTPARIATEIGGSCSAEDVEAVLPLLERLWLHIDEGGGQ